MVYRLTLEYDGTGWHGWQIQPGAPTIQEAVEEALATALRTRVQVVGSGRTDAGVHASCQVAHFELAHPVDTVKLAGQLNGILPRSIAVLHAGEAESEFHARYDAIRRSYRYRVSTVPVALERLTRVYLRPTPDFDRMNEAAGLMMGRHDFSSFCRTASETTNRVCEVVEARWVREGETSGGTSWEFRISADRFLHGMVRAIVGTLLEVGRGKREPADIAAVLDARNRQAAGPAAPARGLVLHHVLYPGEAA